MIRAQEQRHAALEEARGRIALAAAIAHLTDLDGFLRLLQQAPPAEAQGWQQWAEAARILQALRDCQAGSSVGARLAARPAPTDAPEGPLVAPEWACPRCGERRMDELLVGDDEAVTCASCGCRYYLPPAEEEA